MAAGDLDELNDFEANFERSAASFLNTDVGVSTFRTVIEDSLVTPRIEVQFGADDAMEPFAPHNGGSSPTVEDYRAYNATFVAQLITDNATGGASAHAGYRAKIRTALMRSGANWNGGASGADSVELTGTAGISSTGIVLTGTGTDFTTELAVGDKFTVGAEYLTVGSITTSTALTVATAASQTITGGDLVRIESLTLGPNLPFYDVKELRPQGAEYETDGDLNISQLSWAVVFEIRDDAWP